MQKQTVSHHKKFGFTLIELIMVVAVIAIIATLAISRLSGVQKNSADKLNMANLSRIGSAVETFMAVADGGLNRLDTIVGNTNGTIVTGTAGSYSIATDGLLITTNNTKNVGIASDLYYNVNMAAWGNTQFPPLMSQYYLTADDVKALRKLGLTYLMRYTSGSRFATGDDGEWPTGTGTDPDTCLCVATTVATGLSVPVVNPCAISSASVPVGALAYQSCGQDVRFTTTPAILINGTSYSPSATATLMNALKNGDGILLAFGIGQYASLVGSNKAGLDSAPTNPAIEKDTYRRYFVLIRLKKDTSGQMVAEYAGIMDSRGETMKSLRAKLRQ